MGIHPLTLSVFVLLAAGGGGLALALERPWVALVGVGAGLLQALTFRIARQWERAVILRVGRYSRLCGPGWFGVIPVAETVPYWIDLRTITTPFAAEQTLTRDSVPVDVDAVLFWRVVEPVKAALEVERYRDAVAWAAQTALRDVIGETDLAEVLVGRQKIDARLTDLIDHRTEAWGVKSIAVELRDVKIPASLQSAMSMQAQAERERQARVTLSDSELQVASRFKEAALSYAANPIALQLRAMNILLEGMRHNATVVIVPSRAVETMGMGGMGGLTSLAKQFAPPSGGGGTGAA